MDNVFWYVLTGSDSRHLAMAFVSATVLRRVVPEAVVSLACDHECNVLMTSSRTHLASVFNEIRVFDTGHSTAFQRSRAIKIRLRLELTGEFVYLDSDTLVARRIDEFLPQDYCVAIALDAPEGVPGELPRSAKANFANIGWEYPVSRYFNCGVILWRDHAQAHALAETWLSNWEHSCRYGVELDQPAMAHSDRVLGGVVSVLSPAMNLCPFKSAPSAIKNAAIWHFWGHSKHSGTILHSLMADFQRKKEINLKALDKVIKRQHPWVYEGNMGIKHLVRQGCWGFAIQEVPAAAARFVARARRKKAEVG